MRALVITLIAAGALFSQSGSQAAKPGWKPIEFLFGQWTAKGGGASNGQGSGDFSFEPQINQQIVIRKNLAVYTSGPEAGTRHEDLMVIYNETASEPFRAIYFDSEGHVIRYILTTPAPDVAIFESDGTQPGPKYRLTYSLHGKDLDGKFEIAAPGAGYKPYLTWTSVKK